MKIKVDENLPRSIAELLRKRGYHAETVTEENMSGWKDEDLWEAVQREGMFLITADKGFANIHRYPPGSHGGVLLLRPSKPGLRLLVRLMERILKSVELRSFAGAICVASERGIRIHRAKRENENEIFGSGNDHHYVIRDA